MPSLRAHAARSTFGAAVRALRRWRERGTGPISPDLPMDVLEQGAIEARTALELVVSGDVRPTGVPARRSACPVPSWWFETGRPNEGRTVLYVHGGAYIAGSHRTHRGLAAAFAKLGAARVLLPEYRKAPEHRFPAALDDVLAAYRWLLDEEGADPARTAFVGDSAGGGLALALAVRLRDEGLPLPAGLALMSPWTDLTGSNDSVVENDDNDIWLDGSLIAPVGRLYAGDDVTHPWASPLLADLTGLPPMLVHVGTHEVLHDDARLLVARAREAGVDASLGEFDGMWHVFQAIPGVPEGTLSLRELGGFVRRVTSWPGHQAA